MDLERARRASESVASKRNAELSHLRKIKESQTFEDQFDAAWNSWADAWDRVFEDQRAAAFEDSGAGDEVSECASGSAAEEQLAVDEDFAEGRSSEADDEDAEPKINVHELLCGALTRLFVATRNRGLAEAIPLAHEKFDPAYCDGTADEEEAHAVSILVDALNDLFNKRSCEDVASDLLSLDPLPPLWRAGSARWLLYVAEHWPTRCEACGRVQSPEFFHHARCRECSKPEGKLAQLFRYVRHTRPNREVEPTNVADFFPFWPEWRTALTLAYPGVQSDEELCNRWAAYVTEKLQLLPGRWQWIDLDEAEALLPPPSTSLPCDQLRRVERDGDSQVSTERDDALPKAKRGESPSRTKARAAYEYAMERIADAHWNKQCGSIVAPTRESYWRRFQTLVE